MDSVLNFNNFLKNEAVAETGQQPSTEDTSQEYKKGDEVIYLLKDKKKEDYDPKKKPEDQKDVVGVKKIDDIDKDGLIHFTTKDGKTKFTKTKDEVFGKKESTSESEEEKPKEDVKENIVYKFSDFI